MGGRARVGLEGMFTREIMRTRLHEVRGHARRARLGLPLLVLIGVSAGCEIPGMPDDGYEPVTYRERESIGEAARPNPPPVVAGIGGGGAGAVPTLAANAPAGVTQEMVEEGAQLFGTVCSACHGPGGTGTPAAPALNDAQWLNVSGGFDEIVTVIHTGVPAPVEHPGAMPPLGGGSFDDEQVRALASYVFALSQQQ